MRTFETYLFERPVGGLEIVSGWGELDSRPREPAISGRRAMLTGGDADPPEPFLVVADADRIGRHEVKQPDDLVHAVDQLVDDPSTEAIQSFAERRGLLGVGLEQVWPEGDSRVRSGERISRIRLRLAELFVARELADILRTGDAHRLEALIQRHPRSKRGFKYERRSPFCLDLRSESHAKRQSQLGGRSWIVFPSPRDPEVLATSVPVLAKDRVDAAARLVERLFERRWSESHELQLVSEAAGSFRRRLVFQSPLGCAWDGLARSLEIGKPPVQCRRCGRVFAQHLSKRGGPALYCSPSCQKYMARKRKDAMRLRREHRWGPTRIGRELNIAPDVVKQLLAEAKKAAQRGRRRM